MRIPVLLQTFLPQSAPAFTALGADFNGTTQYGTRGGALTGVVDGKVGTLSFWIWFDSVAADIVLLQSAGSGNLLIWNVSITELRMQAENQSGTIIMRIKYDTTPTTGVWHHFLASWNLAVAGSARLYFDDVSSLTEQTYTDDTIDNTKTQWSIGADNAGSQKLNGRLGEFYYNTAAYIDVGVEANRRKFISAGGVPVDLGANGSTPSGAAPAIYCSRRSGDTPNTFLTNRGAGGGFTVQGSPLGDGGTIAL